MTSINTARDLEIKTSIQKLIKEWYELKLDKINFPFIHGHTDIPASNKFFDEEELMMLTESCLDFTLYNGNFTKYFEKQFANILNSKYVISTISENSAFQTAFKLLRSDSLKTRTLLPGDEIITSPFMPKYFFEHKEFSPIFIDIDSNSLNMDTNLITNVLTSKTKAIFIHHTAGNPLDIEVISNIAKVNNLWLIESCFDSIGSKYNNYLVGTLSDISIFGFGLGQQFTTGEGGALAINNNDLLKIPIGNIKMTEMQASIGLAQLRKLPYIINSRKRNYNILLEGLKQFQNLLGFPEVNHKSDPCWAYFPVLVKENAGFKKDELVKYLREHHILTEPIFDKEVPAIISLNKLEHFNYISNNSFKLGIYPSLGEDAIKFIISKISEFVLNNTFSPSPPIEQI